MQNRFPRQGSRSRTEERTGEDDDGISRVDVAGGSGRRDADDHCRNAGECREERGQDILPDFFIRHQSVIQFPESDIRIRHGIDDCKRAYIHAAFTDFLSAFLKAFFDDDADAFQFSSRFPDDVDQSLD